MRGPSDLSHFYATKQYLGTDIPAPPLTLQGPTHSDPTPGEISVTGKKSVEFFK